MSELQQQATVWLLKKATGVVGILVIILGAAGVWSYLRDTVNLEGRRQEVMQVLTGERHRLMEARAKVVERKAAEEKERQLETDRSATATRALRTLGELESPLERWFGLGREPQGFAARKTALQKIRAASEARVRQLSEDLKLEDYTIEGLDVAVGKVDRRVGLLQSSEPAVVRYLRAAWERTRTYVLTALAAWLLGPLLGKLLLYFVVAPPVSRAKPIKFSEALSTGVQVSGSSAALDVGLGEGELLRVKEVFLQASDEGLSKHMRWMFDWRIPFASWACRLVELIELRHPGGGGEYRVTIASSEESSTEFALVTVPEGDSLIVRPWFLAGVVLSQGRRLKIRRRWVLARWQAWMTLQFRFFEFEGPCRLVLAGSRGIRVETLALPLDRMTTRDPARRANQQAIIGFTPGLEYRPVRAETFWAYYRGMNPLFDELFVGRGIFLCQASAGGRVQSGARFWQLLWRGIRRAVGL